MNQLAILFLIPLLTSAAMFLFPALSPKSLKRTALLFSFLPLLLFAGAGYQNWIGKEVRFMWLTPLNIEFYLSIDSLSLLFLLLTLIIIPISLLALRTKNISHPKTFYGFILLLQALLIGFFTARDLALFTIFWEAMLFPLYFIISIWGGDARRGAALKFLLYMIAGSALMVAAVLALYFASSSTGKGTFDLNVIGSIASSLPIAGWIFAIFALAFAVKTPLFPFHAWLPDAYCEAPVAGTVLLSALLSKAGIYGFLRIGIPLFPQQMQEWSLPLLGLSIAGVLYGGLAAWMQTDYKRLIAYSSFSHVNFILAGIFVWSQISHEGALLQALNHGVTIAGLFIVAGWLEERVGTTSMAPFSGMAKYLPYLCWLTLIFVLSSVALPGTNNFIGEFMILFAVFAPHPWLAAVLGLTVILSVIYMLRWMQNLYFSAPAPFQHQWIDIKAEELLIALPLVFLILWIGIYPSPLLKQVENSVTHSESPQLERS